MWVDNIEKIKDKLRSYFNRNIGIVMNVDNAHIINDGKNLVIIVPLKSFKKFNYTIWNKSKTTRHKMVDGSALEGESHLKMIKNSGGFIINSIK